MSPMPIITLSNGLKVGNLCSGHPFTFTDGSVLPACEVDRVGYAKLEPVEKKTERSTEDLVRWTDIELTFLVTLGLISLLEKGLEDWRDGKCTIILVPYPVMRALMEYNADAVFDGWLRDLQMRPGAYPFRTIRRDGREGDGKGEGRIHINRFCL